MVARPVHRFGVSEQPMHGLAHAHVVPRAIAFYGLAADPDAARAVRDASRLLPPLPAGIDLGDLEHGDLGQGDLGQGDLGRTAAGLARTACPIQVGGSLADAMRFATAVLAGGAAWFVLASDALVHPPACAAGLVAVGTHDLVPARLHAAWVAAGGHIVPACRLDTPWPAPRPPALIVLDLNVVDTGYAAGSPGLNVGGFTPMELFAAMDRIAAAVRPAAVAVCNLAPHRDPRGHTERIAAEALHRLLAA